VNDRCEIPRARIVAGLTEADSVGDEALAAIRAHRDGWSLIDRILEPGGLAPRTVPGAVRRMIGPLADPPAWVDLGVVDSGAVAWWRFGTLQALTLYQSLLFGYQAPGLVAPLALTGRLGDQTARRLIETGQWIKTATVPGALHPHAEGWRETIRLRLLHAAVRGHLQTLPEWDTEQLGVPISQSYGSATAFAGFLVIPIHVAKDLGVRFSARDLQSLTEQWRWIAALMGVPEDLMPSSFRQAELLMAEMVDVGRTQLGLDTDDAGRALTASLLNESFRFDRVLPAPLDRMAAPFVRRGVRAVLGGVSTRWMEPDIAAGLGLRPSPFRYLVEAVRPLITAREIARTTGLFGTDAAIAERERAILNRALGPISATPPVRADAVPI